MEEIWSFFQYCEIVLWYILYDNRYFIFQFNTAGLTSYSTDSYLLFPLGLTPSQKYEIRVQTPMNEDEELPWMEYIMSSNLNNTAIDSTDSDSIKTVMAPINLEAEPASPFKINLTWSDARKMEDVQLGGYYMICYTEVKSQQNCENGDFAKRLVALL